MTKIKGQESSILQKLQQKWQIISSSDFGEDKMFMQKEMKKEIRERQAISHNAVIFGQNAVIENESRILAVAIVSIDHTNN